MNSLADIYNSQLSLNKEKIVEKEDRHHQSKQINLVLHMPEVESFIKHLNLLYEKMMYEQQEESQTVSWFNPGQGAVKQSQSVN